ncbi:MAG: nucleotide exchange factor GrpE [Bacilli bacterium]|nr:nucleotide exchange factor GrpE [Bacilli bacterium]
MEEEKIVTEKENIENKKEKKDHKSKDKKLIEELQNQISILNDKNMRVTAEMLNTVRRKDEEASRLLKYSNESLILELLPTIDNFERALSIKSDNADIINYQKGFEMIYTSLISILNKFEVKEIDCINKEFDPTFHQAVMTEEKEGTNPNIIIEVMQKGYTYKDKVIRPAMVKVSK